MPAGERVQTAPRKTQAPTAGPIGHARSRCGWALVGPEIGTDGGGPAEGALWEVEGRAVLRRYARELRLGMAVAEGLAVLA